MIIKRIELAGKTCRIITDMGYICSASPEACVKLQLKAGSEITDETVLELSSYDELRKARKKAVSLLSRRPFSRLELARRLCDKGISEEIAEIVSSELEQRGYVNDELYAENLSVSLKNRGWGPKKIAYELIKRGINRELAENLSLIGNDKENIRRVIESRLKGKTIKTKKDFQKTVAALLRKGFSYDTFSAVLNEYCTYDEYDGEI